MLSFQTDRHGIKINKKRFNHVRQGRERGHYGALFTANIHIVACCVCEADVYEQRGRGEEVGMDSGDGVG